VGQLSPLKLRSYGVSGVVARSSGVPVDLRLHLNRTYGGYRSLSFRTFLGRRGDNLDRFLLRIKEVVEALRLVAQCVVVLRSPQVEVSWGVGFVRFFSLWGRLPPLKARGVHWRLVSHFSFFLGSAFFFSSRPRLSPGAAYLSWGRANQSFFVKTTGGSFTGMEELISHFRSSSEGYQLRPGFVYAAVEAPKGELGVALLTDGSPRPYRLKVRTPVAHNLHLIPSLGGGVFFADFVASFCSLDVVFGEIDR
jgi:NADH-quinone oxidoreductase subunit D